MEEKFAKEAKPVKGQYGDKYDEDSDSSDATDEDDEGILATPDVDAEWMQTLKALKNKDPAIYNKDVTFYKPFDEESAAAAAAAAGEKQEKPMYLRDYHRENLLKGIVAPEEDEDEPPKTFAQEQDDLKKDLVGQMHAAAEEASDDEDEFLKTKEKPKSEKTSKDAMHPSRASRVKLDIVGADKDSDTFLSNYMEARAWVPSGGARFQPLESDDDEEDERADKFEAAFNMRFEDPTGSNEVLKSYARDAIAAKSVRREEVNSRKKARDAVREKKDAERREREEEKARLRKLKIDEMEEKLQKIKKAAGIHGKAVTDEAWGKILEEDWDDNAWESRMKEKFGEDYYEDEDVIGSGSEEESSSKKKKVKKPKWDDDIDINDIIPDFVDEDEAEKPTFTLSDSEIEDEESSAKAKSSKDRKEERNSKKKAARLERKKIEDLVDSKIGVDLALTSTGKKASRFRYRETSPTSFGLTARDILMAPDSRLNEFAGLKKMASFRDVKKKRKDKKNLGKKARLRQWRKETFGNEDGPEIVIGGDMPEEKGDGTDIKDGKRKKKRSRKNKDAAEE